MFQSACFFKVTYKKFHRFLLYLFINTKNLVIRHIFQPGYCNGAVSSTHPIASDREHTSGRHQDPANFKPPGLH